MTDTEATLRKQIARLTDDNAKLKREHQFAFESWQRAIKRVGVLSNELAVQNAHTVLIPRATGTR